MVGFAEIFQIYFAEKQKAVLEPEFTPYLNLNPKNPEYFEFDVFRRECLERFKSGVTATHLGFLSWKFRQKSGLSGKDFFNWIAKHPGFDVYAVNPFPIEAIRHKNQWVQGNRAHSKLLEAIQILNETVPIEKRINIDLQVDDPKAVNYCNYFVGNQRFWKAYLDYAEYYFRVIEENRRVKNAFLEGSDDKSNFPLVPYFFERLFTNFLVRDKSISPKFYEYSLDQLCRKYGRLGLDVYEVFKGKKKWGPLQERAYLNLLHLRKRIKALNHNKKTWDFIFHLPQDLDLLVPIAHEASSLGLKTRYWCSEALFKTSQRSMRWLEESHAPIIRLPKKFGFESLPKLRALTSAECLISASESNVSAHRFAFKLSAFANLLGVPTITMQHGLENIGLTYNSLEYPVNKVRFISDHIMIWGEMGSLHQLCPRSTRLKCIPVGSPKLRSSTFEVELPRLLEGKQIISVFENLHWERYSDTFREKFLLFIENFGAWAVAQGFSVVVRPHSAGLWLTQKLEMMQETLKNIIIADPRSDDWKLITAPDLIEMSSFVLSTPSTVILDSVLQQKQTIVIDFDQLTGDFYNPLPRITDPEKWDIHHQRDFWRIQEFCGKRIIGDQKSRDYVETILDLL